MTYQPSSTHIPAPSEAGRQIAQLRHVLGLVEQIAERESPSASTAALEEGARIASAYEAASSIVQRRFDALAEETVAWAAAGIRALIDAQSESEPPRAAAANLADELKEALGRLGQLVRA
jgi:hypothetical protein